MPEASRPLPITNQSINSKAAVLYEITRQENVHWFLGLRSAELFIEKQRDALETLFVEQRRFQRKLGWTQKEITKLQGNPGEQDAIEIMALQDELDLAALSDRRFAYQIRDAAMELQTATIERDRILAMHPEALTLTYDELQEISIEAFREKEAYYLASRVWGQQNQLPEGASALLFDHTVDEQEWLMQREMELRFNTQLAGTRTHALRILSEIPENTQTEILESAATFVIQQNLIKAEQGENNV